MKRHLIFAISSLAATVPFCMPAKAESVNYMQYSYELTHHTNLSPQAVQMAFAGYNWAVKNHKVQNKDILTIVDFSLPSSKDRLYVVDLKTGKILMGMPVTHGKGSGEGPWARNFSNRNDSLKSSIGVFVTKSVYYGHHGRSLRINGLEASNSNVYSREVVIHSANYASREFIRAYGQAGNSWGCFAVDPRLSNQLINYVKDGTVLYAYGPSKEYFATTKIFSGQGRIA